MHLLKASMGDCLCGWWIRSIPQFTSNLICTFVNAQMLLDQAKNALQTVSEYWIYLGLKTLNTTVLNNCALIMQMNICNNSLWVIFLNWNKMNTISRRSAGNI